MQFTRLTACLWTACLVALATSLVAAPISLRPAGSEGFDLLVDGKVVAPVRLSSNGAILAEKVEETENGILLSGLHCKDPLAVGFAADSYVSVTFGTTEVPGKSPVGLRPSHEPVVRFKLTITRFDTNRWQALFPDGAAPFHFLVCSMPTAQVWHQRGWLNATPNADPFPLLQDTHVDSPEISCKWNRNWSYLCPLGAHPIPMIGVWDPAARLYVGYDFQEARATDQSERYIATAYCWQQGATKSFIALTFPYGGLRYGEKVYPEGGEVIQSHFHLIIDPDLPDTEDPNERFQTRLFDRYNDVLPAVPAMNDLAWLPGKERLKDFVGPIGLGLWGPDGERTIYPKGTLLIQGWGGHFEMPIDTAARRGDSAAIKHAREQLEVLLHKYARRVTVAGDDCLFWEKPLEGAWCRDWGGPPVTTLHNSDAWYAARVLVELYRYDRARNRAKPEYLRAIDGIFNWTKHFVWTRNEFTDVPSSPFAIGGTLSVSFLLDYYFTFKDDPDRRANAELALRLARNITWRYLPVWAMDSDRFDGALDSAFLIEPNSGRDWAGLACANEVHLVVDLLAQVYVHTGDTRMRYYLRGILQRWPALYRSAYEDSLADYGDDAMTEGLGLFAGSGPGRGGRYNYGAAAPMRICEPVGESKLRVVAGTRACIAFCKGSSDMDVADYRTDGNGDCSFRIVSSHPDAFDVSFSYPYVNVSGLPVSLVRAGRTRSLKDDKVRRPPQSPSSLYFHQLRNGDIVNIGKVPQGVPACRLETPRLYTEDENGMQVRGQFEMLPLHGDLMLPQDWNDVHSFAGLVPGEHWVYGVPYRQGTHAITRPVAVDASGVRVMFVAYAPPEEDALAKEPLLVLDDGSRGLLTGKPVLAWRGWPPIFNQMVLLDYAVLTPGRTVRSVDPDGTLLMGVTAFTGEPDTLQTTEQMFADVAGIFAAETRDHRALFSLREHFTRLPFGRIAVLPGKMAGAGSSFMDITRLRKKCVNLSEQQLVNPGEFNAARYPIALYLGGERYVKTVTTEGDGNAAIIRYLAGGGTLILLATEPFPLFYGDGPAGKQGKGEPLLPMLGMPLECSFEQPPLALHVQLCGGQSILHSVPSVFPFPPGDPRLRAINRVRVDGSHHYTPLLSMVDAQGRNNGDAAFYFEFGSGPAKGGRVLYIWSTLLGGPEGNAIMKDAVSWALERIPR